MKQKFNVFSFFLLLVLCFYSILLLGMFIWALINSFKDNFAFTNDAFGLPDVWHFENYANIFDYIRLEVRDGAGRRWVFVEEMFLNSILYSLGCTIVNTMTPCIVAYLTAKYKFKLNKIIHTVVIVAMILPIVGSLPSELQLIRTIGIYDHIWGMYILKANFLGMYFLVFYGTFRSLSWEYAEAALIDGASHFTVMVKIMLPLVKSTIFAVGLLMFIGFWNDYQTPMLYIPSYPTVSFGVFSFEGNGMAGQNTVPNILAASILLMLPMVIIFIIFKNKFIGNLTVGGIKG